MMVVQSEGPGRGLGQGSVGWGGQHSRPSQAHLGQAHLGQAHLGQAHLGQAHLGQAHLGQAHLGQAHLGQAHLGQAPGQTHPKPPAPTVQLQQQHKTALSDREQFVFAVPHRRTSTPVMVEWKNTFNVRPVLLSRLRARRNGLRQGAHGVHGAPARSGAGAPSGSSTPAGTLSGPSFGAARSLDLLRANLQSAINKDIKAVLNKYMERFFQPAMENIRVNLGLGCEVLLLEEQVRVVLQRVLEEAKLMYSPRPSSRRHRKRSRSRAVPGLTPTTPTTPPVLTPIPKLVSTTANTTSPVMKVVNQVVNGALGLAVERAVVPVGPLHPLNTSPPPATLHQMFKKRKEMDAEAEARRKRARLSGVMAVTLPAVTAPPPKPSAPQVKVGAQSPSPAASPGPSASSPGPTGRTMDGRTMDGRTMDGRTMDGRTMDGRTSMATPTTPLGATPALAHINYLSPKWDPSRITPDTMFVMGARANKVLGYETSRGRLYTKHQDLFKYASDQEDKEWLARNQLIQPTGGKAFLCILQDIHELAVSQEYKNNPNVNLLELKGFRAPEFLLRKIRAYMRNLRAEPLDDLSGLLEMDLLQEDGVAHMDDSSLMELALEYGVTLMSDDPSPSPSPASSVPGSTSPASPTPPTASTADASPEASRSASTGLAVRGVMVSPLATLTPLASAAARAAADASSAASSTPASPQHQHVDRVKGLIRSQSLPAPTPFMMESLALEELELYIKSHSVDVDVEDPHFEHMMAAPTPADPDAEGDGALDASLDASLEANLDANLDLNLDVNLDVSGAEHSQLDLAWDFIGELNTPTHSPGASPSAHAVHAEERTSSFPTEGAAADEVEPGAPVGVAPAAEAETLGHAATASNGGTSVSGAETSLAMSHATLTALLAGNTLEGLDIPDGLL